MKLTVADIFGDNMVLQRGKKVVVWGTAENGSSVTVEIDGVSSAAIAQEDQWRVELPPLDAAASCEMIVSDDRGNRIVFGNVAIGEVWIAGGQSNMEMAMYADAEYETVKLTANNPNIRFYDCPRTSYEGQFNDEDYSEYGFWRSLTAQDLQYFSAAGYYFAEKVYGELGVPVGIVGCNWGGSPAAAWADESYLTGELECFLKDREDARKETDLDEYIENYKKERARLNTPEEKKRSMDMMRTPMLKPFTFDFPFDFSKMQVYMNGPYSPFRACGLYHTMLEKIMPYTSAGVIWYQGEADARRADIYDKMFGEMIRCWRDGWKDELPFLFVQIAPLEPMKNGMNDFVQIRAAQEKAAKTIPNTYMACIMDVGMQYDIHPKQKRPVGERLALLAFGKVYGKNILCDSPEAVSAEKKAGSLTVRFDNVGEGLRVDGDKINALELLVNGESSEYNIEVGGSQIHLSNPLISETTDVEVRFAWVPFCDDNLYNSAGLPVKPFLITA